MALKRISFDTSDTERGNLHENSSGMTTWHFLRLEREFTSPAFRVSILGVVTHRGSYLHSADSPCEQIFAAES